VFHASRFSRGTMQWADTALAGNPEARTEKLVEN